MILAAGGETIHVNTVLITTLVIGIPSIIVALGSYWVSTRARHEQAMAVRDQIDAEAYMRAKELYESAIVELRQQVKDLNAEVSDLRREVRELRSAPRPPRPPQRRR